MERYVKYSELVTEKQATTLEKVQRHIAYIASKEHGIALQEPCFLPPEHPQFNLPSKEMVRQVINALVVRGYSRQEIASFLGCERIESSHVGLATIIRPRLSKNRHGFYFAN